jgi:YfiH family protein
MKIDQLIFLQQAHTNQGVVLTDRDLAATMRSFQQAGDYLVTNVDRVGLGVMTGDCLPIIIHDTFNNAAGVIHAGWKGSVAGIGPVVLARMQQEFDTSLSDIRIFFGPSAKSCCYEVKEDFLVNLEAFPFAGDVVHKHADRMTFDLPGFNRMIFEGLGVKKEAFHFDYNRCTMCDPAFYSHRRDANIGGRQMTVVSLT